MQEILTSSVLSNPEVIQHVSTAVEAEGQMILATVIYIVVQENSLRYRPLLIPHRNIQVHRINTPRRRHLNPARNPSVPVLTKVEYDLRS